MDLASVVPELDLYDESWPIWTNQRQLPPAKFVQDFNGQSGSTLNSVPFRWLYRQRIYYSQLSIVFWCKGAFRLYVGWRRHIS